MDSLGEGEGMKQGIKELVALLYQGVSLCKPFVPQFKATVRAIADYRQIDLEVEEALLLGGPRQVKEVKSVI